MLNSDGVMHKMVTPTLSSLPAWRETSYLSNCQRGFVGIIHPTCGTRDPRTYSSLSFARELHLGSVHCSSCLDRLSRPLTSTTSPSRPQVSRYEIAIIFLMRKYVTESQRTDSHALQGFTDYDELDSEADSNSVAVDADPIPNCEGISIDGWSGMALVARHDDGSPFADVIIVNVDPNACVDGHRMLGEDNVGVVVLQVLNGDADLVDTLVPWPKRRLFHCTPGNEVSVYDHARKRSALDEAVNGGVRNPCKRRYRYAYRTRALRTGDRQRQFVSDEALSRVYTQRCCSRSCTRKFGVGMVRALRTEMHLQSFHMKSMKNLEVHRAIHDAFDGNAKVVTLEGEEICVKAWRIIHNVSLRTFQRYAVRARRQERGAPHGNASKCKRRSGSIQAVETLRSLLEAKADLMPHMQCTLRSGERVGMKVLPAGTRWNQLLPIVNQVRLHPMSNCISIRGCLSTCFRPIFWNIV